MSEIMGTNSVLMQFMIIGALIGAAGNIIAIIAFWMKMEGRLKTGEAAHNQALFATASVKLLEEKFNDYREQAAKDFLTDRRLIEAENRMTKSVDDLRREVQGMNVRFDRFMQAELERIKNS